MQCRFPTWRKTVWAILSATRQLDPKRRSIGQPTTWGSLSKMRTPVVTLHNKVSGTKGTPNTPDFSHLSEDWWTYQEDFSRHKTWKLHNEVHKMKKTYVDVHRTKYSKEYFHIKEGNTSKAKPIVKSTNRMFIVDSGSSLHMKGEVLSIRRKRKLYDRQ